MKIACFFNMKMLTDGCVTHYGGKAVFVKPQKRPALAVCVVSCKITKKNPMKFGSDYKALILCMRNADDCAIPSRSTGSILRYCVVLLCIWFSTARIAIKYW